MWCFLCVLVGICRYKRYCYIRRKKIRRLYDLHFKRYVYCKGTLVWLYFLLTSFIYFYAYIDVSVIYYALAIELFIQNLFDFGCINRTKCVQWKTSNLRTEVNTQHLLYIYQKYFLYYSTLFSSPLFSFTNIIFTTQKTYCSPGLRRFFMRRGFLPRRLYDRSRLSSLTITVK